MCRFTREHGLQQMKRMGNHGSQLHMGSSSMLADPNFQGNVLYRYTTILSFKVICCIVVSLYRKGRHLEETRPAVRPAGRELHREGKVAGGERGEAEQVGQDGQDIDVFAEPAHWTRGRRRWRRRGSRRDSTRRQKSGRGGADAQDPERVPRGHPRGAQDGGGHVAQGVQRKQHKRYSHARYLGGYLSVDAKSCI